MSTLPIDLDQNDPFYAQKLRLKQLEQRREAARKLIADSQARLGQPLQMLPGGYTPLFGSSVAQVAKRNPLEPILGAVGNALATHSITKADAEEKEIGTQMDEADAENRRKAIEAAANAEAKKQHDAYAKLVEQRTYDEKLLTAKQAYDKGLLTDKRAYDAGLLTNKQAYDSGVMEDKQAHDIQLRKTPSYSYHTSTNTGGGAGATPVKTTEGEKASAGFLNRMEVAEKLLSNAQPLGYVKQVAVNKFPAEANLIMSAEEQKTRQAQEDWVRAKLRKESGAVIGAEEMQDEIRMYFPQAGDSPDAIKQKAASRQEGIQQIRIGAGGAAQPKASTGASGGWDKPKVTRAPAAAEAYLKANPGTAAQFKAKFGYLPGEK